MLDMNIKFAFQDLFAELLADMDISSSAFSEYFDSLCLNVILKNLDIERRKYFIEEIINSQTNEQIMNYLHDNLPNFDNILREAIAEDLKKSLPVDEMNYE